MCGDAAAISRTLIRATWADRMGGKQSARRTIANAGPEAGRRGSGVPGHASMVGSSKEPPCFDLPLPADRQNFKSRLYFIPNRAIRNRAFGPETNPDIIVCNDSLLRTIHAGTRRARRAVVSVHDPLGTSGAAL